MADTKKPEAQTQNKTNTNAKGNILFIAYITCIVASILLQRVICKNWEQVSDWVFGFHMLTGQFQKFALLKHSLVYIASLQFIIAMVIMSVRILGQKISPVSEQDNLAISLLNRILSNNIEQSFIFFALYSYLLFQINQDLDIKIIFALPLLFLIGRATFAISYILATILNICTIRSLGFAFVIVVNYLIIFQVILGKTSFVTNLLFNS